MPIACISRILIGGINSFFSGYPYLILFVTRRCNFNCPYCLIKDLKKSHLGKLENEKNKDDMPLKLAQKIARAAGPIIQLTLTGGEPFIRDDLCEIAHCFYRKRTGNPLFITIPTNGFFTEKVIESTKKIANSAKPLILTISISIDGPQKVHDKIKGQNSYDHAIETVKELKKLKKDIPSLRVEISTTATRENFNILKGFQGEIQRSLKPDAHHILLQRGRDFAFDEKQLEIINSAKDLSARKKSLCSFQTENFIYQNIFPLLRRKKRKIAPFNCSAGINMVEFLWDGTVLPCEPLGQYFLCAPQANWKIKNKKRLSDSLEYALEWLRPQHLCKNCTFECASIANNLFGFALLTKLRKKLFIERKKAICNIGARALKMPEIIDDL